MSLGQVEFGRVGERSGGEREVDYKALAQQVRREHLSGCIEDAFEDNGTPEHITGWIVRQVIDDAIAHYLQRYNLREGNIGKEHILDLKGIVKGSVWKYSRN